ncbi:hypothetical protein Lal_00012430 [Lupinus albus]|nr:hypothetical protein Lal_00012430 [Lupinus albus]
MDHKLPREFLSVNILRFLRKIGEDDSNEIHYDHNSLLPHLRLRNLRCSAKEPHLPPSPSISNVPFSPPKPSNVPLRSKRARMARLGEKPTTFLSFKTRTLSPGRDSLAQARISQPAQASLAQATNSSLGRGCYRFEDTRRGTPFAARKRCVNKSYS